MVFINIEILLEMLNHILLDENIIKNSIEVIIIFMRFVKCIIKYILSD